MNKNYEYDIAVDGYICHNSVCIFGVVWTSKIHIGLIRLCDKNLVISRDEIHETKKLSAKFVANLFVATRDRQSDYFSHGVERNVVYTKAP